jgi:hypothetical protein
MRCRRANSFGKPKYKTMTKEQKQIVKDGRSLLTSVISPEDKQRLDQWIDRHLINSLDLALKQAVELEALRQLPDLVANVKQWGADKGITGPEGKGTLKGQVAKTLEEVRETMCAVSDYSMAQTREQTSKAYNEIIDGVGDCTVTLILLADLLRRPLRLANWLQPHSLRNREKRWPVFELLWSAVCRDYQ